MSNMHPIFAAALAPFAPPSSSVHHRILARVSTGAGMGDSSRARCSCGWQSAPFYEHEDYQSSNLRDAERAHLDGGTS